MYGHLKWSQHSFELDFGPIQINFLTSACKSTFSQVLISKQVLKNTIFIFIDISMLSRILMEFKKMQVCDFLQSPYFSINLGQDNNWGPSGQMLRI